MKILSVTLWLFLYSIAAVCQSTINELPMYGGRTKNQELLDIDQQFIATAVQQAGNRQSAAQELVKLGWHYLAIGNSSTAIKRFNQAWLLDSTVADVYFGFNAYLHQRGEALEAERFMKLGRKHDAGNNSLLRYYGSIAHAQEQRQDRVGAIATYHQMLFVDNVNPLANSKLGYLYLGQQDTARANKYLTSAIRLDAQDSTSYLNRGWLRYSQKKYAAAISDYTQAIRINPHYISAYANRAIAYADAGNYTAALADWQQGLERVPLRDKGGFYRLIGQTKLLAKDQSGACTAFQQALQWGDTPAAEKEIRKLMKQNCR